MTYNVFGGTLNLAQSITQTTYTHTTHSQLMKLWSMNLARCHQPQLSRSDVKVKMSPASKHY